MYYVHKSLTLEKNMSEFNNFWEERKIQGINISNVMIDFWQVLYKNK